MKRTNTVHASPLCCCINMTCTTVVKIACILNCILGSIKTLFVFPFMEWNNIYIYIYVYKYIINLIPSCRQGLTARPGRGVGLFNDRKCLKFPSKFRSRVLDILFVSKYHCDKSESSVRSALKLKTVWKD